MLKKPWLAPLLLLFFGVLVPSRSAGQILLNNLHDFASPGDGGANPAGGTVLSGNNLYGTTGAGGAYGSGIMFKVNTDGTGLTNVYVFSATDNSTYTNVDGAGPNGLLLEDNLLFGTAKTGGTAAAGTIFSLDLGMFRSHTVGYRPPLTITSPANSIMLTWPTNDPAFRLQSTPNLAPLVVWTPVLPDPVVVNGAYVVTTPNTGPWMYYQLSR